MKYGIREICEVVLKAKATQVVGNKKFYRGEPVCYFDTLKTSGLEGAATTVYAQGGRGNSRLMAWEGERTLTFTMEDALISPEGFMILSGAGLIESNGKDKTIKQHVTETLSATDTTHVTVRDGVSLTLTLSETPFVPAAHLNTDIRTWDENYIYVMLMKDGEIVSEPFIPDQSAISGKQINVVANKSVAHSAGDDYALKTHPAIGAEEEGKIFPVFDSVLVDYYVERKTSGMAKQIEITPDKFGGNYYLEASTLFRGTNGMDYPAEFVIPNCKIQSNFNFNMSSSGDPSTFTFTMDAFPDYTKFDKTKKVLAAIQIIDKDVEAGDFRSSTYHTDNVDAASMQTMSVKRSENSLNK